MYKHTLYKYIHASIHTYAHTNKHAEMHTYKQTYMQTYIYTYTRLNHVKVTMGASSVIERSAAEAGQPASLPRPHRGVPRSAG